MSAWTTLNDLPWGGGGTDERRRGTGQNQGGEGRLKK